MTGALLAKEGYQVTVLEKNAIIGGGLQTFKRNGVRFPTGMHIFGGFQEGGNLRKIFAYLGVLDKMLKKSIFVPISTDFLSFPMKRTCSICVRPPQSVLHIAMISWARSMN